MASGRFTVQSISPGVTGAVDIGFFDQFSTENSGVGGIEEAMGFSILEHSLSTFRVRVRFGIGFSNNEVLNVGTDYLFEMRYDPTGGGANMGRLDVEFRRAADKFHLFTSSKSNSSTLAYDLNSFGIFTNDFDRIEPAINVFIDNLTYSTATVIPGDFNRNNVVDAADYPLWRKLIGDLVPACSGPDANCNGAVDNDDYRIWKSNFGSTGASGAVNASSAAIAEPATGALCGVVAAMLLTRLRSRKPQQGTKSLATSSSAHTSSYSFGYSHLCWNTRQLEDSCRLVIITASRRGSGNARGTSMSMQHR
jgi:hypothetical protein